MTLETFAAPFFAIIFVPASPGRCRPGDGLMAGLAMLAMLVGNFHDSGAARPPAKPRPRSRAPLSYNAPDDFKSAGCAADLRPSWR